MNKSPKYYLTTAIIWTAIALLALYVLFFRTRGFTIFEMGCGVFLIGMCLIGQWVRYFKFRNK